MKNYTIEIKWGIIFFVVSLIWIWFEKLVGLHGAYIDQHATYTNLFALVAILIYVLALLDKRRNYYNNSMTWKQGFISGIIITLVVAVLSPLAQYVTHQFITPAYFANAIAYSVNNEVMNQEQAERYFSMRNYITQGVVGGLILGLLTSALVALLVRKK